jgi:AraC family transcriptional activator of mtrCDE
MTLAANALRNPSLSTEAVAESVGYQSVTAFMRAFKEHTSMTPADWRRMVQDRTTVHLNRPLPEGAAHSSPAG